MNCSSPRCKLARWMATLWSLAMLSTAVSGSAQEAPGISDAARQQIAEILALKDSFSPAEQKLTSNLAFASRRARGLPAGPVVSELRSFVGGMVDVEIKATISDKLLARIAALSGKVKMQLPKFNFVRATVPLSTLHLLAEEPEVISIREPSLRKTNVGAVTTQGYISHRVRAVIAGGINGNGVKVGVLSDSASSNSIALLQASGDLGTNVTVLDDIDEALNGGPGTDEGTAMMEIIHDLAPGAQLYFASAYNGMASFADNVNLLAQAGCSIIVDHVSYSEETVFQDDIVAQAINTFVAGGGLFVSAAGNRGNLASGNSSTWQGDFVNNGLSLGPIPPGDSVHGFLASTNPSVFQSFDRLTTAATDITLQWSDPLGHSGNDYDLFILNSAGTAILGSSTSPQTGLSDPFEECFNSSGFAANSRIVIVVKAGGFARALFLHAFDTGTFQIATSGGIFGHLGAQKALTVTATYWDSADTGTKPFQGTNNPVETSSSDGPRRMFFNPNGTPITSGNFLFATGGGTNLFKPELTAADGVTCKTPGFQQFFGTSAAAAHVAGVAALVKSAKPSLTAAQIRQILINTAMDNMAPGPDINGGYGVVNAEAAVQAALAP